MNIDVAFTPAEVQALASKVCIVVDVVRATSSLTVIMSRKPGKVILTTTIQKAAKFASQQTVHPLLCGERKGLPPEGFDFGNSPLTYSKAELDGRVIIFTSSNGTRAVADLVMAPHVYLGCFLNAAAVVKKALETAKTAGYDILIVCAGREEKFAIDDAYCAGYLLSQIMASLTADTSFELGDGGQAALGIFGYYRDTKKLLEMSGAGKAVMSIGLEEDLNFLMQKNLYDCVPELIKKDFPEPENGFSLLA
ncbi:MAG: 2-phosphosulfolactate phosphatase [Clostridiales bacterium]|jgi:2-phosphosulfolactate phosphatase|nr:2-phosphosulfolactate phosphatase [Clostridiales bacterium]MDN5281737.1 2-phosphosulfolactate phosphatase [Candidatus Ozemobacter sp.]